jgi:L-alanine-DL-glutamate epimerase-like enolase superfamily enzyme
MKIARIGITHHRLPLDPAFPPSWDSRPRTKFEATIVRVDTDEGLVGVGSGDLMLGLAGHEDLFLGHDPLAMERHARIIDNLSFHYGRCWPLDVALWDLAGKIAGLPVWKLLGGREGRVRAYASSGVLRSTGEMGDAAARFMEEGFAAMKVRFHRADWRDDVAALRAVRERVGDRLHLMVDCNQGWRMPWDAADPWTLKDALAVARRLEELGAWWMEEPLHRADLAGLSALRAATSVRIAGGEMAREMHDVQQMIERRAVDVIQPDVVLIGGITLLRRAALAARDAGIVFTPHTWGNGIGLMANLQLVAGVGGAPFLEVPYDPPEWTPERRDFMLAEPIRVGPDGWIDLPAAPGLGLVLDEDRLAATRI